MYMHSELHMLVWWWSWNQQSVARRIEAEATVNGIGCKDHLDETRPCSDNLDCNVKD